MGKIYVCGTTNLTVNGHQNNPAAAPLGITFCPSNTNAYAVTGTTNLLKINAAAAYAGNGFGTSRFTNDFATSLIALTNSTLATAHPAKIKYRQYNNRLYIPTWENDRVVRFCPT